MLALHLDKYYWITRSYPNLDLHAGKVHLLELTLRKTPDSSINKVSSHVIVLLLYFHTFGPVRFNESN